jgi:teichoic acid transport system ATP-binding protein
MNSFQRQGTTIVIVSHTMGTIQNFCQRALWLDSGQIQAIGEVNEVVARYVGR